MSGSFNNTDDIKEDEAVFGKDAWVYCRDHAKPHLTGWCSVPASFKLGLGITGHDKAKEAYQKCRDFGLMIYGDN